MSDNIFAGYGGFFGKSKRVFICQTGGLQLWTAISMVHAHIEGWSKDSSEYRKLEMDVLRAFPYDTNPDCRCRDCRYVRITRNWSNL